MDLFRELRPLYVSLALLGFFHHHEPQSMHRSVTKPRHGDPCRPKGKLLGNRIYCYVIAGALWFSFVRYVPSFWVGVDHTPGLFIDRVVHVIWFLECALLLTVCLSHCRDPNQLAEVTTLWEGFFAMYREYLHENGGCDGTVPVSRGGDKERVRTAPGRCCSPWSSLRSALRFHSLASSSTPAVTKRAAVSSSSSSSSSSSTLRTTIIRNVILAWFFIGLNMSAVLVFVFGGLEGTKGFITTLCNPFPDVVPVQAFFLTVHFFDTCAWVCPTVFTCTWCSVCHFWFSRLADVVKEAVTPADSSYDGDQLDEEGIESSSFNQADFGGNYGSDFSRVGTLSRSDDSCFTISMETADTHVTNRDADVENVSSGENRRVNSEDKDTAAKKSFSRNLRPPQKKTHPYSGKRFPKNIESLRRLHLQLCACVDALDRTLSRVVLTTYMTAIPLVCFLLYTLVNGQSNAFATAVFVFWSGANIFHVTAISIGCARVHEAVSPLLPLISMI